MDFVEYKGYMGSVEYSEEDHCFCGQALGMGNKVLILYEGATVDELRKDFENGIDRYLECCKTNEAESVEAVELFDKS